MTNRQKPEHKRKTDVPLPSRIGLLVISYYYLTSLTGFRRGLP